MLSVWFMLMFLRNRAGNRLLLGIEMGIHVRIHVPIQMKDARNRGVYPVLLLSIWNLFDLMDQGAGNGLNQLPGDRVQRMLLLP